MSLKPIKFSDRGKKWAQRQCEGSAQRVLDERRKILVVTQDGKSSHYYFRAWQRRFAKGAVYFSVVSSVHTPMQIVSGLPKLRQHLEAEVAKAKKVDTFHFDEVWVAFDRDSFPDFDAAVFALKRMSAQGYREAWSNECFELWYLLHDQPIWNPTGFPRTALFSSCAAKFDIANRYGVSDYTKLKGKQGWPCMRRWRTNLPPIFWLQFKMRKLSSGRPFQGMADQVPSRPC